MTSLEEIFNGGIKPKNSTMGRCHRTSKEVPLAEGKIVADVRTGEWFFLAPDAPWDGHDYPIAFKDFLRSPAAFVDRMAHISKKPWFSHEKFFAFFYRFREENDLYWNA